jgi:integrase/recombinase XerD
MDNELQFDYYLHGKRLAEASRIAIIKQVNTFLLWVEGESIPDVTEVSYNDVMAFVKHCGKAGNSQKTIAIKLAFLNHYFMWLVKTGEMTDNPASNIHIKGIQRKHLHHFLKREQLDDIYHKFNAIGITGMRNKVILGMVIFQALRIEELSSLIVKDILMKEGKLKVNSGRTTNSRTINLESFQIVDLLEYMSNSRSILLRESNTSADRLFISSSGGDKLYNTFQYILALIKKQDKQVKNWKQLRASVISYWISVYGLRKAQYLAGHRFISSTEEYKQQDLDELQGDVDKFHPF